MFINTRTAWLGIQLLPVSGQRFVKWLAQSKRT